MTQELKVALLAGVVPGTLAGLALLAAWLVARRRDRTDAEHAGARTLARWPIPLAVLLAYPIANRAVFTGWPDLWPKSATERLPHAAMLLAALALLEALVRLPREARFVLRAAAIAGASWMLGGPYMPRVVDVPTFVGFTGMAGLLGAAAIALAERGAGTLGARRSVPMLLVWAGAMVPALFFAGLASGAQTGGPLVIAMVVAAVVFAVLRPGLPLDRGPLTALMGVPIALCLATGWQNGAPPVAALVLLPLAPAALAAASSRSARGVLVAAVALLLTLGVAGAQLGLMAQAKAAEADEYGY
jgi:hypothetical protein